MPAIGAYKALVACAAASCENASSYYKGKHQYVLSDCKRLAASLEEEA